MKAYNLVPKNVEMSFGTISVLTLGEAGRRRKLTYVPCERRFEDGEPVELVTSHTGKPKIIAGTDCSGGWIARISTKNGYRRGACGNVQALQPDLVRLIAEGYGALGNAGWIGSWDDVLLIAQPGAVLRVKPTRGAAYYLHFTDSKVIRLSTEEAGLYEEVEIPMDKESYHLVGETYWDRP